MRPAGPSPSYADFDTNGRNKNHDERVRIIHLPIPIALLSSFNPDHLDFPGGITRLSSDF